MMEQISLGDQIVCYDGVRTRAAYAAMKNGSAERCGCPYCRNFLAQRSTVYPEGFRILLDQLGIDPEKVGRCFHAAFRYSAEPLYSRAYLGWPGHPPSSRINMHPKRAQDATKNTCKASRGFAFPTQTARTATKAQNTTVRTIPRRTGSEQ